ncbi:MAG TPA: anion transporter [Spirochaetales bacterium]|nr:anion transporter [Spirochaetales bacterium]
MTILTELVIIAAILGIAIGRYPVLRMNRATIALVGAVAVVAVNGANIEKAFEALDLHTLALLFSMMIISVNLRLSGFFGLAGRYITRCARTPSQLLALLVFSSGILSALFLNDTIVLMFTPLVTAITLDLHRDPIPYLVGIATAANIGSAATLIGNPQNMMIGIASHIDFFRFLGILTIPSLIGLLIVWGLIRFVFRKEFKPALFEVPKEGRLRVYRPLLFKSLVATGILIAGILIKLPLAFAALLAASFLLITRRLRPERVFTEIDWSLLVLFSGLFVLTNTLREDAGFRFVLEQFVHWAGGSIPAFAAASAILSNLVSNVPAVMLLSPVTAAMPNLEQAWITLAMSSTYAGNFTLLGSVANLIVAESAKHRGVHLSFWKYFAAGAPITLLTLTLGSLWLEWLY